LRKHLTKKKIFKLIRIILIFFAVIIIASTIATYLYIKDIDSKLPSPTKLAERNKSESSIVYDRNGIELYRFFSGENRELVKISDIPDYVKNSLIASEDSEYYTHEGYNLLSTIKCLGISFVNKIFQKSGTCGGSTITQQLVRNTILSDEFGDSAFERTDFLKSLDRKAKEIISAYRVELSYSKDEILQMYMNEVPLGSVNYGLQTASKAYFNKDLKNLSLSESATLIGFIQSPSSINPLISGNYERYKIRRDYVLNQLAKHKDRYNLTDEQINAAKTEIITFKTKEFPIKAPHFIAYIKPEIEKNYGTDFAGKGLRIYTTLDYSLQKIAEEKLSQAVNSAVDNQLHIFNGGVLAISPGTDQILSMVGSADYWKSTNEVSGNVNTLEKRLQMGSSVKPYTYLTAIDKGYGPWLLTPDIPGMNEAINSDSKYWGLMTVNKALVESRNVPATYVQDLVGRTELINTYKKLNISKTEEITDDTRFLTLGNFPMSMIEHTDAFNVFPSEGKKAKLTSILQVTDINGKIIEDNSKLEKVEYYSNDKIYQMNWMLCRDGTATEDKLYYIDNKKVLCGKTGTSDEERNLVTMMYHKNLLLGVWMGNTDGTDIAKWIYSSFITAPVAKSIIEEAKILYVPEKFEKPTNVKTTTICTDTGAIKGTANCPSESSIYIDGSKLLTDTRKIVYLCKTTMTEPISKAMNGDTKYTNAYTKFDKKLELTSKQSVYDNYLKSIYKSSINYIPEQKDCYTNVGDVYSNEGTVTTSWNNILTSPANNSTYGYNENIHVSFSVNQTGVNSLSSQYDRFRITLDGAIPLQEITILEGPYKAGTYTKDIKASDLFEYQNIGTPSVQDQMVVLFKFYLIEKTTNKAVWSAINPDTYSRLNIKKP